MNRRRLLRFACALVCISLLLCSGVSAVGPHKLPQKYQSDISSAQAIRLEFSEKSAGQNIISSAQLDIVPNTWSTSRPQGDTGTQQSVIMWHDSGVIPAGANYMRIRGVIANSVNSTNLVIKFKSTDWGAKNITKIYGTFTTYLRLRQYNNSEIGYDIAPSQATLYINGPDGNKQSLGTTLHPSGNTITTAYNKEISAASDMELDVTYQVAWHKIPAFEGNSGVALELYWTDQVHVLADTTNGNDGSNETTDLTPITDEQKQTNGLLSTIIQWIGEFFENFINSIIHLFVPTEADMQDMHNQFDTLLKNKLGFIYQCFVKAENAIKTFQNNKDSYDPEFTIPAFPEFSLITGEKIQLWKEPIKINLGENPLLKVVQPLGGTFVIMITGWAFVNKMKELFEAFVAGRSWWDYQRGGTPNNDS